MSKKIKMLIGAAVVVIALAATTGVAFAASAYSSPAEAVADLTGRGVQSVIEERSETGKTFGAIAREAGQEEPFRAEMLEMKRDRLTARVKAGVMTQEKADEIMKTIRDRQESCDGTGAGQGTKRGQGAGFGFREGDGKGAGFGFRQGQDQGAGGGHHGRSGGFGTGNQSRKGS